MDLSIERIVNGIEAALIAADGDGRILFCNKTAASWLGGACDLQAAFDGAEFLGRFDGWPTELRRLGERGHSAGYACAFPAASHESPRFWDVRVCPLNPADAADAAAMILIVQGAPAAAIDERLEVARRLASLGKLAARVAHELNNPLDGILRYINLALRLVNDTTETKLKSYLSESRTGLMRMVQIIGDLLEYSRSTEGQFDESDIGEVVEEAVRSNSAVIEAAGIIVTVDFQQQPLPAVRGSRLYQVCCNLIRNAVDAMPGGGRLAITAGVVGDGVVIRVADTGVGLPEDVQRIFEPFFTTKGPGKGTGLGLALCKDFIEDMGGTITAASGDESGAVFTVRIPIASCLAARQSPRQRIVKDAPAPSHQRQS